MISIFTPAYADLDNINAQNLAVKNIVSALDPDLFQVTMVYSSRIDPRIEARKNTKLIQFKEHHKTLKFLTQITLKPSDIFFYPGNDLCTLSFLLLNNLRLKKTKLVTHVLHEINATHLTDPSKINKILRRIIRKSDAVAGNSQFVTQGVQEFFLRDAETIYDPIDQRHFYSQPKKTQNMLSVLYAGTFQDRKRPWMIVEAAQRYPHIKFRLAGKGPAEDLCKALAVKLKCNNVEFLGNLTQEKLGEVMRNSDIFLFPSVFEGLPQVLGQAAACGLPAVAMACYKPETIVHNSTGFLAENDEEFHRYVDLLCTDADLRAQYSKEAVLHTHKFSIQTSVKAWSDIFTRLMN